MLLSKTAAAFTMSVERFFAHHRHVYFWTFTFKTTPLNDDFAMMDWNGFAARLKHYFPFIEGLRVSELHRSHGIHFHFLLNERIPIRRMKKICYGSGHLIGRNRYLDFGRMSVSVANIDSSNYLAKYLRKSYREQNDFGRRRRWGTIGGFKAVKIRNLIYESQATRNRDILFGSHPCGYGALLMLTHITSVYGHVDCWPSKFRALVRAQPLNRQQILLAERQARPMRVRKVDVPF